MCNISLRKAAGVIREFMDNGIIEGSKVYSGGKHKNLRYTKVHCLELIKKVTETNESGKILSTRFEAMGVLPESLWTKVSKKQSGIPSVNKSYNPPAEDWYDEREPF
jgi:hypothetical protein